MIVRFVEHSIVDKIHHVFSVDSIVSRGTTVYFYRSCFVHYYLKYDSETGKLFEYLPSVSVDCPNEYNVSLWWTEME